MEQQDIDKKLKELYKSNRKSGMLYTLIPLGIIFTVLMVFWSRLEERDKELDAKSIALTEKEKELIKKENRINELIKYAGESDSERLQINSEIPSGTPGNKIDTSTIYYQQIEQKNRADSSISKLKENKSIDYKTYVKYYMQPSDGKKVIHALEELGIKYEVLNSEIQNNPGPINSIKYGHRVDQSTVDLLALQLIKEGFQIRSLEPVKKGKGNETQIVLYRSSYVLSNPVITADHILNKKGSSN